LHNVRRTRADAMNRPDRDRLGATATSREASYPAAVRAQLLESDADITALLQTFSETPSSQEMAVFLQEPLANLRVLLGAGLKEQVAKSWTQEILPAAKDVEKGFPFVEGTSEADLTKVTAFLNPTDG
jgi:hypothetical protein